MDVEMDTAALVPRCASLEDRNRPHSLQHQYYDNEKRSLATKKFSKSGMIFSYLIGIFFVVFGATVTRGGGEFQLGPTAREIITLFIELLVTIVTEVLGSIHGTSLRWALFHENRLEFNTNLRLFTFARHAPNSVVSNVIFLLSTAICYAAGSLVLVSNTYDFYADDDNDSAWSTVKEKSSLSLVAFIALGTSILVLCAQSTWCILQTRIPTWSSNPLTTIALSLERGIYHRDGRCMMSVHDRDKPPGPAQPRTRQRPLYVASSNIRRVLIVLSVIMGLLAIWTVVIARINHANNQGKNWNIFAQPAFNINGHPTDTATSDAFTPTVFLVLFTRPNPKGASSVPEIMMIGVLFFRMALQCIVTIGLHCVEVLVGMNRDEEVWRTLASPKGSIQEEAYDSIPQYLKSWKYMVLFLLKPIIHWMFGQAMGFDYATGVLMRVPHLTYLTCLWLVLVAFSASISLRSPKGALPASYGHLQVMADIVDEWAPKMYWGDKGVREFEGDIELRHAGTSEVLLDNVGMNVMYA